MLPYPGEKAARLGWKRTLNKTRSVALGGPRLTPGEPVLCIDLELGTDIKNVWDGGHPIMAYRSSGMLRNIQEPKEALLGCFGVALRCSPHTDPVYQRVLSISEYGNFNILMCKGLMINTYPFLTL